MIQAELRITRARMFLKIKYLLILGLILALITACAPTTTVTVTAPASTRPLTSTSQPPSAPITSAIATPQATSATAVEYQVARVVDGDTIEVSLNGKSYTVRYIGIDTPETVHPGEPVQPYGPEASAKNKELASGKTVRMEKDVSETDKYGRLLRYIWVGSLFINAELVKQGFAQAVSYPPDVKYQDLFLQLQREARDNNRGLWALKAVTTPSLAPTKTPAVASTATPIPINTPTPTPTSTVTPKPPSPSPTPITSVVYVTRTGTKYHRAGCRYLSSSSIPISKSDAIARGLGPCSVCKP